MAQGHQWRIFQPSDARLGRHYEHDPRSEAFAFTADPPAGPGAQVDTIWADTAPVLDQAAIGACVGFTGADILNTAYFDGVRGKHNNGQFYTDEDGLTFYSAATANDEIAGQYPPQDTGSSGLGLAKALQAAGLITSYLHAFTWAQFEAMIQTQPVAVGTVWTQQMFTPDANGVVEVGPINDSTIAGGHEYMARAIDFTRSLILCRNHWQPTWNGDTSGWKVPGEFWLTFHDAAALFDPSQQPDIIGLVA